MLSGSGKLRPSRVQSVVSSQGSLDSDMLGETSQNRQHGHTHNHHSSWSFSSLLCVFQVMMAAAVILSVKDPLWMSRRDRRRSCLISGSSSEFIRTEWRFSPTPGTARHAGYEIHIQKAPNASKNQQVKEWLVDFYNLRKMVWHLIFILINMKWFSKQASLLLLLIRGVFHLLNISTVS